MGDETPDVAMACQGGGSHTAFTAGVLAALRGARPRRRGGRIQRNPRRRRLRDAGVVRPRAPGGDPGELSLDFWATLSARTPVARLANDAVQFGIGLHRPGVPATHASPFHSPAAYWGQAELGRLLEEYVDFRRLRDLATDTDCGLFVGAIDVLSGTFELFREDEVSADPALASAAEPNLFNAVEIDGRYYWDGLFSKNPPLKDFLTATDVPDPEEVWLVRINPQSAPGCRGPPRPSPTGATSSRGTSL